MHLSTLSSVGCQLGSGILIGNSGDVGSLKEQIYIYRSHTILCCTNEKAVFSDIPVDDKVGPQVGDHPGNLPVEESEVKDARREQIDQLVTMGHSSENICLVSFQTRVRNRPWDWISGNAPWKEEVPQAWSSIVLKGVEVGFGISEVVELHELVGGGLDEEGSNHLKVEGTIKSLPKLKL